MRITGLSMDGFGIFHDVDVADLPPGLCLFVGDNEAGKSTTLAFVHTVLFGYPDGRTSEKAYPALRGGQDGGRLRVASEDGEALILERRPGKRGGPLTVTAADGSVLGEAALAGLLGGVTRALYRKLYAFSLYELEQFGSLNDESVRDVIYGASLGSTTLSLPEVRSRLEGRQGELFKPSGSKPEINALLRELEEVRAALREARRGASEYQSLAAEQRELESRIEQVRADLRSRREGHERLKAYLQLWDDWTALQEAEGRLAELPETVEVFPEQGLARLDDLAGKLETETDALRQLEEELNEKRERLQRLGYDAALVERESEVRALVRGLGTYEQAAAEIPGAQEKLRSLARQTQEVLAEFGSGLDEAWVLGMDRSPAARSEVEAHAEALKATRARVERAEEDQRKRQEERDEAANEADRTAERTEELAASLGEETPAAILTALRERRTQFQELLRDQPQVEQQQAAAAEDLAGALRDISPAWTAQTLDEFDASLTARQRVTEADSRLSEAATAARETANALARAEEALTEADELVEQKAEAIEQAGAAAPPMEALRERRSGIRALREAVVRHDAAATRLEARREAVQAAAVGAPGADGARLGRRLTNLAALLVVMAAIAGAGLWLTVSPVFGIGAAAGLALVALVVFAIGRSAVTATRPAAVGAEDATASLEQELTARAAEIEALKARLSITGEADLARVNDLEDENAAQAQQAEALGRLRQELKELQAQRERRETARDTAAAEAEAARGQQQEATEAWEKLVAAMRLPPGTSPRTGGEVFAKAETARGLVRQVAEYDRRLAAMATARDEYLQLMRSVPALAPAADEKDGDKVREALAAFLAQADRQEAQRRELADARKAAASAAKELTAAEKRLEEAAAAHRQALAVQEEGNNAWINYLTERDMPATWSPETCLHLLDRAGRLTELVAEREETADRVKRLQQDRAAYETRIRTLCAELGRAEPAADKLVAEVHALEADLGEALEKRTESKTVADEIPKVETRCANRRARIEELQGRLKELMEQGASRDEETFRRRGRLYEQRQELLKAIADCGQRVRKVAGETDLEALRAQLGERTLPDLTVAEGEAREQVAELEAQLEKLQQERTEREVRRQQLLDEDRIARLRAQEEGLLERFRELSADWARHAVALHLLGQAKDRFEKSHQPEVIRRAGQYFRSITRERYQQLFAPHGEQTLEVIDRRDRRVAVENLSRGTSEQLYLAIRFGYIASQDAHRERLPLLMDDVMVNFDPTRAREAAKGILEMAQTHQVLFFTCHPETVEVFRGCREDLAVFGMGDGGVSRR